MNNWTKLSVDFANQRNYLDELYKVYPISPNLRREISQEKCQAITKAYQDHDNKKLVSVLLELDLFPIKDSYVAYLKKDKGSINRNPQTINRIAGTLYQMGLEDIFDKCSMPKETNRQLGPMFKHWIGKGILGVPIINSEKEFLNSAENCIYNVSDREMKKFAEKYLGYTRDKGLDFIAKFNEKYILAEAKFLTDFGGHQNAQFDDAIHTIQTDFSNKILNNEVKAIAIMDGVLYIKGKNKMYNFLEKNNEYTILSSLLLREFLYSV